jgi:hypothetical protein
LGRIGKAEGIGFLGTSRTRSRHFPVAEISGTLDNEEMNGIPRELDWVKARAACSLAQVFKELQLGVEDDVRTANVIRKLTADNEFGTKPINQGFVAYRIGLTKNVRFFLETDRIEVHNDLTNEKHSLSLTLNEEGRCKLLSNGAEYEQWQVRKIALEGLFFPAL